MKTTKTKRLLAACLALMLTIGLLATGVFAAKNTTVSDVKEKTGSDGQIVVTVYDQAPGAAGTGATWNPGAGAVPVDGVGINALRIGSVVELTTSTTDDAPGSTPTIKTQVAFGLNSDMATLLGLDTTDDPIAESNGTYYYAPAVVQTALGSANNATIESALEANGEKINKVTGADPDTDGVATFSDLDYGLYLLAKSELPSTATTDLVPFLVSVPMYVDNDWTNTVYAYPKVRTGNVTIEKAVDDADKYVNAGQTLKYTVTTTIPASQSATGTGSAMPFTSFTIADTNTAKSLNINSSTVMVKLNGTPLVLTEDYTVQYTDVENNTVLTITLTDTAVTGGLAELNKGLATAQTITVTYDATVATDVNFSNKLTNTATATYQREGMESTADASVADGKSNQVNLYTYGLDLTKTLSDGRAITAHTISFELYKDDNGRQGAKIPVVARNGNYWVAAEEEEPAVTMFVGTNGKLNLYGLEPGTYYLKELATQSGYTLLDSPITIVITANETPDGDPTMTATVNKATAQVENGVVYLQVENTKNDGGFNLPQTGGAGTLLATAIGLGLLCAGVVLLVAYRKKSHS